jgi:hypothetical protein
MDAAGRGRLRRPSTELPQPPQRVADPAVEKDLRSRLQATPGSAPAARSEPLGWRGPSHGGLTAASPVNYAARKLSSVQPIVQQRPVRRLSTDYFEGSGVVAAAAGVVAAAGGGSQAVAALRRADSATFGDGTQQLQQQSVPSALKRRSSQSKVCIFSMISMLVAAAIASYVCSICALVLPAGGLANRQCCDNYACTRTSWCLEEGSLGSSGETRGGVTLSKALTCTCT